MSKWKLINKFKRKKELFTEAETKTQFIKESKKKQKIPEIMEDSEEKPIKEYNEMLYSKDFIKKKPTTQSSEKKQPLKRSSWENLGTIEHNIDDLDGKKTEVRGTQIQIADNIDNKVDHVLYKKKVRH